MSPVEDLADALRTHAGGLYCTEAAVELLIGHRHWLTRTDFVSSFVEVLDAEPGRAPMAMLDWSGALDAFEQGELACSSSEAQMLRLAASLASGIPVDLQDALCGLDLANTRLVAAAVLHAAGHRTNGPRHEQLTPPRGHRDPSRHAADAGLAPTPATLQHERATIEVDKSGNATRDDATLDRPLS